MRATNIKLSHTGTTFDCIFKGDNKKYTHGLKGFIAEMITYDVDVKNVIFDTEIGAYLLEPSRKSYDIEGLSYDYLNISLTSLTSSILYINYNIFK